MGVYDILREKLDHEMNEFRNSYNTMSVTETYNDWYIIGFMEEYYDLFSSDLARSRFDEKVLTWLSSLEVPLDSLYQKWMKADGAMNHDWDAMVDFVHYVYNDEKHREKQSLYYDIKALGIKVVERVPDEFFDNFDFRAHISDQTVIFSDLLSKHFDKNINEQFNAFFKDNLLVKSCDYGCNTYPRGVSKEVAPGNMQTYQQPVWNFIEAVEQMFNCKCTYYDEVNGFEFAIAFGEGDSTGCYVFGAGNNGQEFCQSLYFNNLEQLSDASFVKALTTIDKAFYTLLEEYELGVASRQYVASLEDMVVDVNKHDNVSRYGAFKEYTLSVDECNDVVDRAVQSIRGIGVDEGSGYYGLKSFVVDGKACNLFCEISKEQEDGNVYYTVYYAVEFDEGDTLFSDWRHTEVLDLEELKKIVFEISAVDFADDVRKTISREKTVTTLDERIAEVNVQKDVVVLDGSKSALKEVRSDLRR